LQFLIGSIGDDLPLPDNGLASEDCAHNGGHLATGLLALLLGGLCIEKAIGDHQFAHQSSNNVTVARGKRVGHQSLNVEARPGKIGRSDLAAEHEAEDPSAFCDKRLPITVADLEHGSPCIVCEIYLRQLGQ